MSFLNKVFGRPQADSSQPAEDNNLGLMHLRKLFAEFRHPSGGQVDKEQEDKLYNMLPLFCKVFGGAPSSDMTEKFGDILQFCSHVSRLMVTEIRRRASNQSTEAASCAIVKFLEIGTTEETSNGWMLLSTVNLLSTGSTNLIECMTVASLPSTLVKCLYLFFDLPVLTDPDAKEPGSEFTAHERRVLLQKIFVQVLTRLCIHSSPAEELARKDDLTLLFSAITSWCPQHNRQWRKNAGEVLMTLSRHGLTPNVVQYIHSKGCVALCVENMQRNQDLSPLEIVEMFVAVFCFLKDSSEVSQILLDDFRACQGYIFLTEFILTLEKDNTDEAKQALRNLVLLVGSLTTCGYIELKPTQNTSGSLYQMPGFSMPTPAGKGVSVRNIQAFQVLQSVFLRASSSHLCSIVLDVIGSIYQQDSANYFILEPQHTLSQFAEKIHTKPEDVQKKFFEILEFICFNLNFIPCKELISVSILLKTQSSMECGILCMKSLLRILRSHIMYKDVFREVGLLEVLVTNLHRFAALLKDSPDEPGKERMSSCQKEYGFLAMEALSALLSGNSHNAGVFRECGGARCAHNMVPYPECRQQALGIVQQLVLSSVGDDDMGTLLGLMHTAPVMALDLKTDILKSLLTVLRESHRTRTVFRKVGGFVYVMSVLVAMEGCLAEPPKSPWDTAERKDILILLRLVFNVLTVAMRYEPANAKFFATDVQYASLTKAVRLLGCFSNDTKLQYVLPLSEPEMEENQVFDKLFYSDTIESIETVPKTLLSACWTTRLLYDMALDTFDKSHAPTSHIKANGSPILPKKEPNSPPSDIDTKKSKMGLPLGKRDVEPIIVHAGAVISMLHLLPAVTFDCGAKLALKLQIFIAHVLKTLMKTERNQQVMSEAGLPHELLRKCTVAMEDETHPLHSTIQYIFERLAAQSLTPKDLRDFLRLGSPLNCQPIEEQMDIDMTNSVSDLTLSEFHRQLSQEYDEKQKLKGKPVPLTRVKCLVSMTTPRDAHVHGSPMTPPFVQFDMRFEGWGCLYLPSIAPQGPPTPSVVGVSMANSDAAVVGGIGTGERIFPPPSGMSFSTWVCVDKFSLSGSRDAHPPRLLSIVRNLQGREENSICLAVFLSPSDRALIVSTKETLLEKGAYNEGRPNLDDTTVRFWCPELGQEGQWHHFVVVLNKAGMLKTSSASLYVNGQHVHTNKLNYISPNVGVGGTASPSAVTTIYSYIGTPPSMRKKSSLMWRQGPCHLFEEVISASAIQTIFQLGPNYVGSFQAPPLNTHEVGPALAAEDHVMFGIHASSMSYLTLSKIRKNFNKQDSKAIAKQLSMSAHDSATPIRILHNAAGHLSGPARSMGAVLMGYLGIRIFSPHPVAVTLENVGGTAALLGLVAMANDVEGLYAAVKALTCAVKSNKNIMLEMERTKGYQMLALLLKKKQQLLNSHILHLTFSLVGTVDSGTDSVVVPNKAAFEDILCNLEIWHEAPGDLQKSLYEHYLGLLTEGSDDNVYQSLMEEGHLVFKLLHILEGPQLNESTVGILAQVLKVLLKDMSDAETVLRFGQFVVSTLPPSTVNECSEEFSASDPVNDSLNTDTCEPSRLPYRIFLRNTCLDLVMQLLHQPNPKRINQHVSDEIQRVLGFDWLFLFMQNQLHPKTVVLALQILTGMLADPTTLGRFRDGSHTGGWLNGTEAILENRVGVLLGFNVGATSGKNDRIEINTEMCHLPGFLALQWLLPKHSHIAELYYVLMALLLGQEVKRIPKNIQFDLDSVWTFIFGVPASQPAHSLPVSGVELCPEAALVILAMIRNMLNQDWQTSEDRSWIREYPVTLLQFLLFLYHNQHEFVSVCSSGDFLCALASTLFPWLTQSQMNSEAPSPVEEVKALPNSDPMLVVPDLDDVKAGALTTHPAKKLVMDFIRQIVFDNLSLPSNKSMQVVDMLFETSPEHSTLRQQKEFQTDVMKNLMDHLLAADALLGEQAALSLAVGGSYSNIVGNVFHLASRTVDKLWQGMYVRPSNEVFEFISKLISQAKRRSSGVSLEPIYKCLNRVILYHLSQRLDAVASQMSVLEALHRVTHNRNLVFGPGNYDQEFIGCLCYCLLQLTPESQGSGKSSPAISRQGSSKSTKWHVNPLDSPKKDKKSDKSAEGDGMKGKDEPQGCELLAAAAKRVWEELYVAKKPVIEDVFKINFSQDPNPSRVSAPGAPNIGDLRPQIQEAATRIWQQYMETEKNRSSKDEKLHTQLQSRLQKVGSGVTGVLRMASRRGRKEVSVRTCSITQLEWEPWLPIHTTVVRDLVQVQLNQTKQNHYHMEKYLLEEWMTIEGELMRERGLWGPPTGTSLDKWMLDMTEGPCRMRKKMMGNELFYTHYPFRPDKKMANGDKKQKYRSAVSKDSQKYFQRYRSRSLVGDDNLPMLPENGELESVEEIIREEETDENIFNPPSLLRGSSNGSRSLDDEDSDNFSDASVESTLPAEGDKPDNETVLRLLEEGEKITHMFRCASIQGLDTAEGLLLFGKEHFYVVDGFTLLKTREIVDIDTIAPEHHDPIIPNPKQGGTAHKRSCNRFNYEGIKEVHKRRYLLQPIALEVFSADGRNFLLAFPKKVRNKVYARFMAVATSITDNAHSSVSGQKQSTKVEPGTGLISNLIGERSVTQRWERGEISNFQYLMSLNTLAGRSYNDLMQYPVFPWIVADYDSEELDLNSPSAFRDLSKPMGAQSDNRLKQFKKRFQDWDDPQGETPPYHYGTHYSSAMIVASYLVRMEPFTQHFLRLQGGHFDLADRMFHSVRENWLSASQNNMADVRELIPEFFYLPDFLVNSNNFDFGVKQSGVALGDTVLPTWAKGDPREFIRAHREALESDYVSAHLHEWIDLIFGYKQQGQPAIDAVNVFHYLFYEGNVDIYSIDDPLKKNATIGFINNFGQIPKQLFKKPHPQKKLSLRTLDSSLSSAVFSSMANKLFYHNVDNLKPSMNPIKELKSPVGQIIHIDKGVLAVEQNKVLIPTMYNRYLAWGYADHSLRVGSYDSDKALSVFENLEDSEILCASCPTPRVVVTGGTSTVVNVWKLGEGKDKRQLTLRHPLYGHTGPITCLVASSAYNVIVSGSRDRTCIIWDLSRLVYVRQLRGHSAPVAAVAVNELTGDIASCAGTYLHVWSINGELIAYINTASSRNQQILCVAFSQMYEWDIKNVIMTGSTDGVVRMWSVEYVQIPSNQPLPTMKDAVVGDTPNTSNLLSVPKPPPGSISASSSVDNMHDGAGDFIDTVDNDCSLSRSQSNMSTDTDKDSWQETDTLDHGEGVRTLISLDEGEGDSISTCSSIDQGVDVLTEIQKDDVQDSTTPQGSDDGSTPTLSRENTTETSPTDSDFVVVTEAEIKSVSKPVQNYSPKRINQLRDGFKWQRQLVFRSKLTMHTAFERKDNKDPAPVTALAVSKDHKTIYVGDSKGRVFSWSVTNQPGRVIADHWVRDEVSESCVSCSVKFTFSERRHHCRNCGQVFCAKCSKNEIEIFRLRIQKPVRVCQACFNILKSQQDSLLAKAM